MVRCTTQVGSSQSTLTRNTQVSKLFLLVHFAPNRLISIQNSEYLQHLGEHKDKVIRCRLCNKEFKTITRLRVHTKTHVNQCPFCSENFLTPQALQDHMKESHEADPGAVERQCSLCKFTSDSISKLAEHNQSVHCPYGCNICFLRFSTEYKLEDH